MSGADFSLTTFSPSGKLVQIEYALNAVQAGKTSLGIKGPTLPPPPRSHPLLLCPRSPSAPPVPLRSHQRCGDRQ